jgi:translation initiation factor IF-2
MSKVRINDLARELEVKSRAILDALTEVGVTEKKTHSSSLEADEAERVRGHFHRGGKNGGAPARSDSEPKPKIDWSRVSKPGDVLKAIQRRKEEAEAESHRAFVPTPAAPPRSGPLPPAPVAAAGQSAPSQTTLPRVAPPPASPGQSQPASPAVVAAALPTQVPLEASPSARPTQSQNMQNQRVPQAPAPAPPPPPAPRRIVPQPRQEPRIVVASVPPAPAIAAKPPAGPVVARPPAPGALPADARQAGAHPGSVHQVHAIPPANPVSANVTPPPPAIVAQPQPVQTPPPIPEVSTVSAPPTASQESAPVASLAAAAPVVTPQVPPPPTRRMIMPQTGPRPVYTAPPPPPAAVPPAAMAPQHPGAIQRGRPIFDRARPGGGPGSGPGFGPRPPQGGAPGGARRPMHPTRTQPTGGPGGPGGRPGFGAQGFGARPGFGGARPPMGGAGSLMPPPGEAPRPQRPGPQQRRGRQQYPRTKEGPMKGFAPPPRFSVAQIPQEPVPITRTITVTEGVSVKDLAEKLGVRGKDLIATLLVRGVFVTVNQSLDAELVKDVAAQFGADTQVITFEDEMANEALENLMSQENVNEIESTRPPSTLAPTRFESPSRIRPLLDGRSSFSIRLATRPLPACVHAAPR